MPIRHMMNWINFNNGAYDWVATKIKWFADDSYVSEDMQNRLSDSYCHFFFQKRNTVASREFVIFKTTYKLMFFLYFLFWRFILNCT